MGLQLHRRAPWPPLGKEASGILSPPSRTHFGQCQAIPLAPPLARAGERTPPVAVELPDA